MGKPMGEIPPLPMANFGDESQDGESKHTQKIPRSEKEFDPYKALLNARRRDLDKYVKQLSANERIKRSDAMIYFLTHDKVTLIPKEKSLLLSPKVKDQSAQGDKPGQKAVMAVSMTPKEKPQAATLSQPPKRFDAELSPRSLAWQRGESGTLKSARREARKKAEERRKRQAVVLDPRAQLDRPPRLGDVRASFRLQGKPPLQDEEREQQHSPPSPQQQQHLLQQEENKGNMSPRDVVVEVGADAIKINEGQEQTIVKVRKENNFIFN